MRSLFMAATAALFCCSMLSADVLDLTDGSRITGTIKGMAGDKVTIDTKFAGSLSLPLSSVTGITSDNDIFVHLASGSVLKGKVSRIGGRTSVTTANGVLDVSKDNIANVWAEGTADPRIPAPPAPRKWKYQVGINVGGKTGNTEKFSGYGTFDATLDGAEDRLKFYGRGGRSTDNGNDTVKEVVGGIDYEANFTEMNAWYVRGEMEYDEIEGLDLRSTAAVGFARYAFKEDDHMLRGRLGFLYRHESYNTGMTETKPGIDVGLSYMNHLWDWGKLTTDATFTPSIEDFSDYRAYQETKISIPLERSEFWVMQLGFSNEYNSLPIAGRKELDTTYFLRLTLNWD